MHNQLSNILCVITVLSARAAKTGPSIVLRLKVNPCLDFSMYTLLSQRRLRWLGHVHRMANGRIPKDMLYGELVTGTRTVSRPYLRYRDTCKRDMKVAGIDTTTWEAAADDRGPWRAVVNTGMKRGEENRSVHEAVKREKRKQKSSHPAHPPQPTIYICHKCSRDCHARVGLISHSRKCK